MRVANTLKGYELLDASCGERLERWGSFVTVRPDPQIVWETPKLDPLWNKPDAKYTRSKIGGGSWEFFKKANTAQVLEFQGLKFWVRPMNFKHMGVFPEQATNWEFVAQEIKKRRRKQKVLNLFGYTGVASLVAAAAGAEVCHVDAARKMLNWGRENMELSGVPGLPIRWIADDCIKFVRREIRRGNKYDIVILDPPSYGNGTNGEIWRLEDDIYGFLNLVSEVLSENFAFVLLNLYTGGLAQGVANYLMASTIGREFEVSIDTDEIGLEVAASGLVLPCGLTCIAQNRNEQ